MEDSLITVLRDILSTLDPNYRVSSVNVIRSEDYMRIEAILKPRKEGATLSAWRLIEMEERIMSFLRLDAELVHTRIGVNSGGLLLVFLFRRPRFK